MLNFDELDKKYSADICGKNFKLYRNDTEFEMFKGEYKISEIFDKINNNEIGLGEFDVDGCIGRLEDFIAAKQLNDELKVITHNNYVLIFGSLDHLITKEILTVPGDFTDLLPEYTQQTYSFANQVLGIEEQTEENKSAIDSVRKMMINLFKYNSTYTVDDILGEE